MTFTIRIEKKKFKKKKFHSVLIVRSQVVRDRNRRLTDNPHIVWYLPVSYKSSRKFNAGVFKHVIIHSIVNSANICIIIVHVFQFFLKLVKTLPSIVLNLRLQIFHNKTSQTVDFQGREALQQTMTQQTMK